MRRTKRQQRTSPSASVGRGLLPDVPATDRSDALEKNVATVARRWENTSSFDALASVATVESTIAGRAMSAHPARARMLLPVRPTILMATVALMATVTSAARAEPEVVAQVEKQRLYLGESLLYRVTLLNVEQSTRPELPGFDDFDVTYRGEQSASSQRITIINGRRSQSVEYKWYYDYDLIPTESGDVTIPAPVVRVDNKQIKGNTVSIQVVAPQKQDVVIPAISIDPPSVFPTQSFTVTLSVLVKPPPTELAAQHPELAGASPIAIQRTPPALSIPWFEDDQLSDQLMPEETLNDILGPTVDRRRGGFQINNLSQRTAFSFFDREALRFHPAPKRVARKDDNGDDVEYFQYDFSRRFSATAPGQHRFGPVTVKGVFATGAENGRPTVEELYAIASPATLVVRNVPDDGRPESWIGAVGDFEFTGELVPTEAHVGDPLTLTLSLSGEGTLENAFPPNLSRIPAIADNFRIYDATQQTEDNARRFTYSLRPKNDTLDRFPSIEASWFDVTSGKYITERTDEIPITISPSERLESKDIVVSDDGGDRAEDDSLEISEGGIFANDTDLRSLRNERIDAGRWLSAWCGVIICAIIASTVIRRERLRQSDPAEIRRRQAVREARKTLASALVTLESGDVAGGADGIRAAYSELISAAGDLSNRSLTAGEVGQVLEDCSLSDVLVSETSTLLKDCESARYGAAGIGPQVLAEVSQQLFGRLVAEFRNRKLLR